MIAHPSLVQPDGGGPVEEQHITHKVSHNILSFCEFFLEHFAEHLYHHNPIYHQFCQDFIENVLL